MSRVLKLYCRPVCPLCDDGYETVSELAAQTGLIVEKINVEGQTDLEATHGHRVPVVVLDGEELGWGRLSRRALERKLWQVASKTPNSS